MDPNTASALRAIPSIDAILANTVVAPLAERVSTRTAIETARSAQARARAAILSGEPLTAADVSAMVGAELRALLNPPYPEIINATGVIIQTNLGRAPVSAPAGMAMERAASNFIALETELETGERGGRGNDIRRLFTALTGAEDALVVNNNAAAVMLALSATSAGGEVIVSRGEAVEIGGGFRIPDVLRQSGATLVEVGTTNRTYARDYAAALTGTTTAILRVHASNFAMSGFVSRPSVRELTEIAEQHGVLMIEDVGSGTLLDTAQYGLSHEPTLQESIAAGVDLVCASGDKLLGGPQAGIILGRAGAVDRLRRHPLARALRADKTALAGLGATLQHYLVGEAEEHVPVWWMISRSVEWLRDRCDSWSKVLASDRVTVVGSEAVVGGGSLPGMTLPSVALSVATSDGSVSRLAREMRLGDPHVFPRIEHDRVLIDARTVLANQDDALLRALTSVLHANT